MAVQHAKAKKQVLTEIMKLMDKVGGHRLSGKPMGGDESPAAVEHEASEAPSDDEAPSKPGFTFMDHGEDSAPEGDDEPAPSDDELDAMEAKLKKHGRR